MAKGDPRERPPLSTWLPPEGVAVLAAAGATAAIAAMPVVLVPGVLAYGVLSYLRYGRWKEASAKDELSLDLPDTSKLVREYATRVQRSAALGQQILAEVKNAEPSHRSMLISTAFRVKGLVASTLGLATKLAELDVRLVGIDKKGLDNEAKSLQRRVDEATDAQAKQGYERAMEQQQQKVLVVRELWGRRERIDAQLTNIELTLETVSAQILRIKSTEAANATVEGARVIESLDALSIDIDAVAETVDESSR